MLNDMTEEAVKDLLKWAKRDMRAVKSVKSVHTLLDKKSELDEKKAVKLFVRSANYIMGLYKRENFHKPIVSFLRGVDNVICRRLYLEYLQGRNENEKKGNEKRKSSEKRNGSEKRSGNEKRSKEVRTKGSESN